MIHWLVLGAFGAKPTPFSFYRKYLIPNKLFSVKNIQGWPIKICPIHSRMIFRRFPLQEIIIYLLRQWFTDLYWAPKAPSLPRWLSITLAPIIRYVTENNDALFPVDKTPLLLPPLAKRLCFASTNLISIFSIDVFWKGNIQGSWKHCRIYKLSKFPEKFFACYKINGSNSGGVAKANGKPHFDLC